MLKPIIAAVVIGTVILTECLVAYFVIPSTADLEKWAAAKAAGGGQEAHGEAAKEGEHGGQAEHGGAEHGGKSEHGGKAEHGGKHDAHAEAELEMGKYTIVIHKPAENVTMRVTFHLIGTAEEKEKEEFTEMYTKTEHRLRDAVISEIRNSAASDLTDPGLGLIKRRILAKSNILLGKPILKAVLFSDFTYLEQ